MKKSDYPTLSKRALRLLSLIHDEEDPIVKPRPAREWRRYRGVGAGTVAELDKIGLVIDPSEEPKLSTWALNVLQQRDEPIELTREAVRAAFHLLWGARNCGLGTLRELHNWAFEPAKLEHEHGQST
jgi:hypothetical protein